jgi:hypothetical protein
MTLVTFSAAGSWNEIPCRCSPATISGGDTPAGGGSDGVAESTVVERLGEIPGVGPGIAQVVLAEIGLDMSRFPTAEHLVSWAKLCPPPWATASPSNPPSDHTHPGRK